jgi:hypothetical protein
MEENLEKDSSYHFTAYSDLLQGILQSPGRASRPLCQDESWYHFEGFQMNLLNGP